MRSRWTANSEVWQNIPKCNKKLHNVLIWRKGWLQKLTRLQPKTSSNTLIADGWVFCRHLGSLVRKKRICQVLGITTCARFHLLCIGVTIISKWNKQNNNHVYDVKQWTNHLGRLVQTYMGPILVMLAILINFKLRGKKFFMLILIMVARATKNNYKRPWFQNK